ncbi:MAG TPA: hypothetical protein VFT95_05605, partial [Micromonosporaceae bacterium]|nr:hypothetical protein [Micromonosporaceae bacterium]
MRRTGRTLLAAGAATLALGLAGCGGGGGVDASGAEGRKETAAELARAAQAQKICFGWKLIEGNAGVPVSQGSNLGDAKPVESDPQRCPRWVEVRASYYYTAESDEADDWATFEVATSPDLSVGPTIR